jgi:integrase
VLNFDGETAMASITDKGMQAKPTGKDQWLNSPFKRGAGVFVGRITPNGERLLYFRYTNTLGNRQLFPIGPHHTKGIKGLTLADAYAKACELSELYRNGIKDLHKHFELEREKEKADEAKRIQSEKNAIEAQALDKLRQISVRQLYERWASVELKPQVRADGRRIGRKDGGKYTSEQFERRLFPTLGDVDINAIRKSDLVAILDKVKSEGKRRTCNMLLADMKQMFRFAHTRELIPSNPLSAVSKKEAGGSDAERIRTLSADELVALRTQLKNANLSKRTEIAVRLILATGCRIGELSNARWENVDLVNRKWLLPETKNQRPHTIHLSDFALDCFQELQSLHEVDASLVSLPWVFPNQDGDGPVCSKSVGKQLADRQKPNASPLQRRCKLTNALTLSGGKWTAHDLRRTSATLMAQLGMSTDVIDECLNHMMQRRISRVYIQDRRELQQAQAFNALGKKLEELMQEKPPMTNVFELELKRA